MNYFGKYRGKVENNLDPQQMGRMEVSVPSVFGEDSLMWAMPCVPYAGQGVGLFAIPPNGANIWVEFEGGNPDYPIWSGFFWGLGENPVQPTVAEIKVLKTENFTIKITDLPGAEALEIVTGSGKKIQIDATQINIDNGQGANIKLQGPNVTINGVAIEVI